MEWHIDMEKGRHTGLPLRKNIMFESRRGGPMCPPLEE